MPIEASMNAVTIDRFGGPEVLRFGPRPVPAVANGQVLIKVAFAGVGSWDPLMREGVFADITGETPVFPMILGTDGAGTIAQVGEDANGFAEGDAVYFMGANAYAEFVAMDADAVSLVPNNMPLDQASAMPIAALTSIRGLVDELRIGPGDTVLVTGASGDVGHVAVGIAKLLGARVLAVASGDDGARMARELGADLSIDGRTADVAAAAREFAPGGLDGVLAFAAGPILEAAVSALRAGGRVAYPLGVEINGAERADVTFLHFDLTLDSPAVIKAKMKRLNDIVSDTEFEVRVSGIVPIDRPADAHDALGRHRLGRILLSTEVA